MKQTASDLTLKEPGKPLSKLVTSLYRSSVRWLRKSPVIYESYLCRGSLAFAFDDHCSPLSAQERMPLTNKIARSIRRVEPGWLYNYAWCTCPPTVPGQVWRDIGVWERKDKQGHREFVEVQIVKAASSEESAEWMRRFGGGGPGEQCLAERYELVDEAYLLKCPPIPKSIFNYQIVLNYRKGRFLVRTRGSSPERVGRFGRYAITRLPAG